MPEDLEAISETFIPFKRQLEHHHQTYQLPVYALSFSKPTAVTKLVGREVVAEQARESYKRFVRSVAEGNESLHLTKDLAASYCPFLNVLAFHCSWSFFMLSRSSSLLALSFYTKNTKAAATARINA